MDHICGLIIQAQPYAENDRLVTVFSEQLGLFRAIARKAQKLQAPLYTQTQPLTECRLLIRRSERGLSEILQGITLDSFPSIREDITSMAYALAVCELLMRAGDGSSEANQALLYNEAKAALNRLGQGVNPQVILAHLELRVCHYIGIAMDTVHCSECGGRVSEAPHFSLRCGGPLCDECVDRQVDSHALLISRQTWRILKGLSTTPMTDLGKVRVREETSAEISQVARLYLAEYAGIMLKSLQVAGDL